MWGYWLSSSGETNQATEAMTRHQAMHSCRPGEEWQISLEASDHTRHGGGAELQFSPRGLVTYPGRVLAARCRPTDPHGAARSLRPAPILQRGPATATSHQPPASSLLIHFPGEEEANEGTWSPAPARTSQETLG